MIQHSCDKSRHLDQICVYVLNAWEEISENMNQEIDDNEKMKSSQYFDHFVWV